MVALRAFYWRGFNKNCVVSLTFGLLTGFMAAHYILSPSEYSYLQLHAPMDGVSEPIRDPGSHDKAEIFHKMENLTVADHLRQQVKILCWIMTNPKNHAKKAQHVKNTWGKRCNVLLFMSSEKDPSLPTVALNVTEGRNHLWDKVSEAFKYVYKHHLNDADWFMKADDDTYVVLENLRYMLMTHSPSEPIYFGCKYKKYVKQGYMSGGPGYVLSKEAVRRYVEKGLLNRTICRESPGGGEDVGMGKCMEGLNVAAGDTRDSLGRGRFFPFIPEDHLIPGRMKKDLWYWEYIYYSAKEGMDCCSDNAVSFHYINPNQMYVLEYLIYHLRPYGISYHVDMPTINQEYLTGKPDKAYSVHF